jgi:hypothetical protein
MRPFNVLAYLRCSPEGATSVVLSGWFIELQFVFTGTSIKDPRIAH